MHGLTIDQMHVGQYALLEKTITDAEHQSGAQFL